MEHWYAIYTRARSEKQVAVELENRGYKYYLPLIKTLRQWSDRKKWVYIPLFNSYVFVKIDIINRVKILDIEGVVKFVRFKDEYPPIPEWQINNLKIILGSAEKFELSYDNFEIGEKVVVNGGPFKGVH